MAKYTNRPPTRQQGELKMRAGAVGACGIKEVEIDLSRYRAQDVCGDFIYDAPHQRMIKGCTMQKIVINVHWAVYSSF